MMTLTTPNVVLLLLASYSGTAESRHWARLGFEPDSLGVFEFDARRDTRLVLLTPAQPGTAMLCVVHCDFTGK